MTHECVCTCSHLPGNHEDFLAWGWRRGPGVKDGGGQLLFTYYSLSVFEISFTLSNQYLFAVLLKMEKLKNMNVWRAETMGQSCVPEGGER